MSRGVPINEHRNLLLPYGNPWVYLFRVGAHCWHTFHLTSTVAPGSFPVELLLWQTLCSQFWCLCCSTPAALLPAESHGFSVVPDPKFLRSLWAKVLLFVPSVPIPALASSIRWFMEGAYCRIIRTANESLDYAGATITKRWSLRDSTSTSPEDISLYFWSPNFCPAQLSVSQAQTSLSSEWALGYDRKCC